MSRTDFRGRGAVCSITSDIVRMILVSLGCHQFFLQGSRYVFDSAMQGKKRLQANSCLLFRLVAIVSTDRVFQARKRLFSGFYLRGPSFDSICHGFQRSRQFVAEGSLSRVDGVG